MTITDVLAIYGAILATAIAMWDVAKYILERRRLRIVCYVAEFTTPGVGASACNLLAYRIANTGGKPVILTTIGGALCNGSYFMFVPQTVQLPLKLQPGESITIPGPMPENIEGIKCFIVHDGVGKEWKASTKVVRKQMAARSIK